ncbi:MAG TPA: hypothetical protein VF916_03610 [Ktedonobacterales bacterium]
MADSWWGRLLNRSTLQKFLHQIAPIFDRPEDHAQQLREAQDISDAVSRDMKDLIVICATEEAALAKKEAQRDDFLLREEVGRLVRIREELEDARNLYDIMLQRARSQMQAEALRQRPAGDPSATGSQPASSPESTSGSPATSGSAAAEVGNAAPTNEVGALPPRRALSSPHLTIAMGKLSGGQRRNMVTDLLDTFERVRSGAERINTAITDIRDNHALALGDVITALDALQSLVKEREDTIDTKYRVSVVTS